MRRLTRDGTTKLVSRHQFIRREPEQVRNDFPVKLTTRRIGNHTRLIHTLLKVLTIHSRGARVRATTTRCAEPYQSFLTRCIGWQKNDCTDHPISYLNTHAYYDDGKREHYMEEAGSLRGTYGAHG